MRGLAERIAAARPGAEVLVPAGRHLGTLSVDKPLTLRGERGAVLDAAGQGAVLIVRGEVHVQLVDLVLEGGLAEAGALVHVEDGALSALRCVFRRGTARTFGGGALYAAGTTVALRHCHLVENVGRQGGALLLCGEVELVAEGCLFAQNGAVQGAALRLRDGARAQLTGCTLVSNRGLGPTPNDVSGACFLSGTSTQQPTLVLDNCLWVAHGPSPKGELYNEPRRPGRVEAHGCVLPTACAAWPGAHADVRLEAPSYSPVRGSVADGAADPTLWPPQAVDERGVARHTTAGYLEVA